MHKVSMNAVIKRLQSVNDMTIDRLTAVMTVVARAEAAAAAAASVKKKKQVKILQRIS